jgi:phosphoserine phosphatase
MTKIYLVRHGETDWNQERRVLGWSSTPLNEKGIAQAKALADLIPFFKINKIYTSPLPRAFQTAQILASALNNSPIEERSFIEANIGSWEGRLWNELADDPVRRQYYTHPETARPPDGETSMEVQKRAAAGIRSICRRHPDESFLIVTHADLIRCIICHLLKIDLKIVRRFWINNASLSYLSQDKDGAALHFLNFVPDRSGLEAF